MHLFLIFITVTVWLDPKADKHLELRGLTKNVFMNEQNETRNLRGSKTYC